MALEQARRDQLNGIIHQATLNGETDDNIQEIVNQFKTKYDKGSTPTTNNTPKTPVKAQPKSVLGFLGNIGKDILPTVGGVIKGAANIVAHPINTLIKPLAGETQLAVDKLTGGPGDVSKLPKFMQDSRNEALAINKPIANAVTHPKSIVDSSYNHPLQALLTASGLLTGTGEALGAASKIGALGDVADEASVASKVSKAGETAKKVANTIDPIANAGKAVKGIGNVVSKVATDRAVKLYDSILGLNKGEAKQIIKTGKATTGQKLVESGGLPGIAKTGKGILEFANNKVDDLEGKIQNKLKVLDATGKTVKTAEVIKPLQDIATHNASIGAPTSPILQNVIEAIKSKGETMTPSEANNLKRNYYDVLRNKNANFHVSAEELPVAKQIFRTAASSLRQNIGKLDPTIHDLNGEQGLHLEIANKMTDALAKQLQLSVKDALPIIAGILNPASVKGAIGTVAGYAAGGFPGAVLGTAGEKLLETVPAKTLSAKAALTTARAAKAVGKVSKFTNNSPVNALLNILSKAKR